MIASGSVHADEVICHLGSEPPDWAMASQRSAALITGPYGIVSDCHELTGQFEISTFHTFVATGPRRLDGWRIWETPMGTGVSDDPDVARLSAIGEAVERYVSMAPVNESLLIRGAFAELGDDAVAPADFALLSPAQYRRFPQLDPLTDTKAVEWCPAYSLSRQRGVLVPAALAHLSRSQRLPNDFIAGVTTTGNACHVSLSRAILAGLCEVLERDALTIAWQSNLPLTRLDPSLTSVNDLVIRLAEAGCEVTLYELPTDSPYPVVLAVGWGGDVYPHAAAGAACRADRVAAASRAVLEVSQVVSRLRSRRAERPERVRSFDDHADLYATAKGAALLRQRLVEGATRPLMGETPAGSALEPAVQLHELVTSLARLDLEVLVVELTTVDVAAAGYRAVRVLVPGTVDMAADARCPRLGGRRLYELPARLGLRASALAEDQLNLLPVPLA